MEEFTFEGGCTKVIPKTHLKRRHPTAEEIAAEEGVIPTTAPPSSVACWDGRVWHGNFERQVEGDRVVLHITYSRLALRPVEDYSHLSDDWFEGKHEALPQLLGREDFLGTSTKERGFADFTKLPRTFDWARNHS